MSNPENRLKQIIYRSWHRGCKETDILLGDFAKANIHNFSNTELSLYEELIEEDDWDIYNWVTNKTNVPEKYQKWLIPAIKNFSINNSN